MEWYYLEKHEPRGPFSEQEMRTLFRKGRLEWNVYVWNRGFTQWIPADEAGFRWPGFLPVAKFLIVRTFFLLLAVTCLLGIAPLTKQVREYWASLHGNARHQVTMSEAGERTNALEASTGSGLKPMPLTRKNAERYAEVYNEPFQWFAEAHEKHVESSDLTASLKEVDIEKQFFSAYPKSIEQSAWGIRAVEKMGYNYNLTLKEILTHRAALASRFTSAKLLEMASVAAKEKDALLKLNKIDHATYHFLQQEYPVKAR